MKHPLTSRMSIIRRQILYPGIQDLGELEPETKLIYHFQTVIRNRKDAEPIVIDDSRRMAKGQPVETIYGKQFKLPIWESCLTSMHQGEICRLTVRDDPITHYICLNYVITSKSFRKYYKVRATDENQPNGHRNQSNRSRNNRSSATIRDSPYKDLNDMVSNPPEIFEFTFELVDVVPPKSYTKDIWQMSYEEKFQMLPKYREDGNRFYADCDNEKAASCYMKGLQIIESLMLSDRAQENDWYKLDEMKKPFLLNLARVKLSQGEYYDCIKFTDEVLKRDPENTKALFRRAKAQKAVWYLNDARDDFKKCLEYDRNMAKTISKCLTELKVLEEIKNREDRERYGKMFGQSQ